VRAARIPLGANRMLLFAFDATRETWLSSCSSAPSTSGYTANIFKTTRWGEASRAQPPFVAFDAVTNVCCRQTARTYFGRTPTR